MALATGAPAPIRPPPREVRAAPRQQHTWQSLQACGLWTASSCLMQAPTARLISYFLSTAFPLQEPAHAAAPPSTTASPAPAREPAPTTTTTALPAEEAQQPFHAYEPRTATEVADRTAQRAAEVAEAARSAGGGSFCSAAPRACRTAFALATEACVCLVGSAASPSTCTCSRRMQPAPNCLPLLPPLLTCLPSPPAGPRAPSWWVLPRTPRARRAPAAARR